MFVECPFCHKHVLELDYAAHERQHTERLADGQMTDHVTVREEDRYQGNLGGVPQVYTHEKCGGATGMPEEIVRSYLVNPFLYNDKSFCTGCNRYVSTKELFWVETGEQVFRYTQNLRRDHLLKQGVAPQDIRYAADGRVLRKRRSATGLVVGVLAIMLFLGCGSAVVIGGIAWAVTKAPRHAPPPAAVVPGPMIAPPDIVPQPAAHNPHDHLQEMRERMEQHRTESQKRLDEMRRQHEQLQKRMREQRGF